MAIKQTDFTTGSKVLTSDGEEYGSVYEIAEGYILVRVPEGPLTDIDQYVPRGLVDRVENEAIRLSCSQSDLEGMDLSAPPTIE